MIPDLKTGRPVTRGPLTLYPLFSDGPAAPEYLTGAAATETDLLTVEEIGGGTVPNLAVRSKAAVAVLVVEGEMLVGARQNRTLNVSVLLPPKTTTTIPVSCVEAGRWGRAQAVEFSPRHAPPSVRMRKQSGVARAMAGYGERHSNQGEVWEEVDHLLYRLDSAAPTSALEDAFEAPSLARRRPVEIEDLRPESGQFGVVACFGGQARALDLFDKPATLEAYWPALLRGYALDAELADEGATPEKKVETFLAEVRDATWLTADGVGLGEEAHLGGDTLSGFALTWEGGLVHLSAFATGKRRAPARGVAGWFRSR